MTHARIASEEAWSFTGTSASSFLFFDHPLRLRWNASLRDTATSDEARARRVACELLTTVSAERWPRPFKALRAPPQRLRRAALLLADAERCDAASPSHEAADAWTAADAEWAWAARSSAVRTLLANRARELGATNPDWVANAVVAAIREELIPLVHLRALLLAPPDDSARVARHRAALAHWTLPESASPAMVTAFGWYLLLLVRDALDPTPGADASVLNIVRARTIDDPLAAAMVAYYVRAHMQLAGKWLEAKVGESWFNKRLGALEKLEQQGGATVSVFEAVSTIALALGLRQLGAKSIADAIYNFAKAMLFDSSNGTAREQYQDTLAAREQLHSQADAIRARGAQLSAEGVGTIAAFDKGVRRANELFDSDEAREIASRLENAAPHGLAWRLGVPTNDAKRREELSTLAHVVDQYGSWAASQETPDSIPEAEYAANVRLETIHRQPALSDLPWDRIQTVLERGILGNADILTLLLPEPELPDLAALIAPIRERVEAAPTTPGRPRLEWAAAWLLSGRDAAYKLAIAAGVILLAYAAGTRTTQAVRDARAGHAYDRVVAGVRARDDSAIVDAGLRFLDRPFNPGDPRVLQVGSWVDPAVARRLLALADARRVDAVQELLKRYEQSHAGASAATASVDGGIP